MKKGIYIYFGFEMEMRDRIDLIKSAGFDSVMVWAADECLAETVAYAREQGLYVSNAHLPFKNINCIWEEGDAGDIITDEHCKLVKKCGELNIPAVVYHVSSTYTPPEYNIKGIERIERVVSAAEQYGVDIAFENLRRIDYLQYVYDNLSSDRIKFCFDCGHHNYLCPELDLFEMFGDKLIAVHLHDNFGDYDWHMLPFDAKVNFEMVTKGLIKVGYEGPISLEVHQDVHSMYKNYTAEQFIFDAYSRVLKLEQMIKESM